MNVIYNEQLKIITLESNDRILTRSVASIRKTENINFLIDIWKTIGDDFSLHPEEGIIYLDPPLYWSVYRKMIYGMETIKAKAVYKDNCGFTYKFPLPEYYFQFNKQDNNYGVYGIYLKDELLYIGFSSYSFSERWKMHDRHFKGIIYPGETAQKIHLQKFNPEEIEYRALISAQDIEDWTGLEYISPFILQLLECSLIHVLQPPYNIEGKEVPYRFQKEKINPKHFIEAYWNALDKILLEDNKE